MSKFLTPGKMADRLEAKVELDRETTGRFTSELFEIIVRELQNDDSFSLFGFGTFKKVYVAPNKGRNPHTGEVIYVPAHYRIKFTPAGKLADRINAEYAHLKPILLEQDEMIHEGLLLKAERYIMTAAAEPEPEPEPEPEIDSAAVPEAETEMIPEPARSDAVEKTIASESAEEAEENHTETAADIPMTEETDTEDYIHQPDFGFKKDNRNRTMKLALLSILALLLMLGLGWLMFRGSEPETEIIVTEQTGSEEISPEEPEPAPEETVQNQTAEVPAVPETSIEEIQSLPETNYSIEPGDSFSLLAQRSWGNIYLWPYLYSRNSNFFPDPDLVRPGDNIVIPPQPDKEKDQIRIEDSILFAYQRYRNLISEQSGNPRNPNRELSAGYVLLGGERLYPSFLDRKKAEIRIEDIRRVEELDL